MDKPGMIQLDARPEVIGPGYWVNMHLVARRANTEPAKRAFRDYLRLLAETFPCEKCRLHIQEYLAAHPIERSWTVLTTKGEDMGMFKYSWEFHDQVNRRLGKEGPDLVTAWEMYSQGCKNPMCTPEVATSVRPTPSRNRYV